MPTPEPPHYPASDLGLRVFEDGSLFIPNTQMYHAGNFSCYAPRNKELVQNHHLDVYSESALRPVRAVKARIYGRSGKTSVSSIASWWRYAIFNAPPVYIQDLDKTTQVNAKSPLFYHLSWPGLIDCENIDSAFGGVVGSEPACVCLCSRADRVR